jgi:hypothetical protein
LVTAFRLGEQFGKRRADVVGVVQAAIQLLRDDMIQAAGGLAAVSIDKDGSVLGGTSALALSQSVAASLQCLTDLEANVRPRLALEAMVLAWPEPEPRDL